MLKKRIFLSIIIVAIVGLMFPAIRLNDHILIVNKIVSLSDALSSGEIERLNQYFVPQTKFVYGNKTAQYAKDRNNITDALSKGIIEIDKTSFYIDNFEDLNYLDANVTIIGWIKSNGEGREVDIRAKLRRTGLFTWNIIEMESSDKEFAYIFIDNKVNIQ